MIHSVMPREKWVPLFLSQAEFVSDVFFVVHRMESRSYKGWLIRAMVSLSPEVWHERLWVQKGRCFKFPFDDLFLSQILSCLITNLFVIKKKLKLDFSWPFLKI